MSSPTMMICLRKDRMGQGVSSGVVFFIFFFFWWGKDRLHLLHVPGLHILQVEKRGGKVEIWYKMLRNLFFGRGVDNRTLDQI